MPDVLAKGNIPEVRGNEAATRLSILQSITKLSEQSQLEQFLVRAQDVAFAAGVLSVAYGPGAISWGLTFRAFPAGTAIFNAPAAATDYYVVARSTGPLTLQIVPATGYALIKGEVVLWQLTTGNPVASGTTALADRRGLVPNTDALTVGGLPVDAIGAAQIAASAVGNAEIAPAAVDDAKLTATGVAAGTYGSGAVVPVLQINAQGRIVVASSATVAPPTNSVGTLALVDGSVTKAKLGADVPIRSVAKQYAFAVALAL